MQNFGRDVETFRADQLVAGAPGLVRTDWRGATWPPTLVHRDWWHKVGGYSSELSPGMSSDNDFSMKLWDAGCRVFLGVGDSLVYHFQQKSTGKVVKNDGRRQFLNRKVGHDAGHLRSLFSAPGRGWRWRAQAVSEGRARTGRLRRALLKSRMQKRAFG